MYKNLSSTALHAGNKIEASITLKNTTTSPITNIKYLDTLPTIFDIGETKKYHIIIGGKKEERDIVFLQGESYDLELRGVTLRPGETMTLSYDLTALPASYGTMIVDDLER